MRLLLILLFICFSSQSSAKVLLIACASNFTDAMKEIQKRFEKSSNHKLIISYGSTGKLYAQIMHGAPFEAFFSADDKRPILLEKQNRSIKGSRFTYAKGKLALWSKHYNIKTLKKIKDIKNFKITHIAIANPKLAPYGLATEQVLKSKDLYQTFLPKMVKGENISQTYQFIYTSNCQVGFVALSQVLSTKQDNYYIIPESLYDPIIQQAVILKSARPIEEFFEFFQTPEIQSVIKSFGYGI
jgi:molybdate transport system substrate-binding protein